MEKYNLPKLPYGYADLEPYISEELLTLHHDKHHAAYVNAANALVEKLNDAREKNMDIELKPILKSLSFNAGGHILHEIFWKTMALAKSVQNEPKGKILVAIEEEFGSFERFKKQFSEIAAKVEGSGWAVLAFHKEHGDNGALSIIEIEKHNVNLYPDQRILLCLDVWEHAYYVDYKNERAKFIESWWNLVNWEEVEKRFSK